MNRKRVSSIGKVRERWSEEERKSGDTQEKRVRGRNSRHNPEGILR